MYFTKSLDQLLPETVYSNLPTVYGHHPFFCVFFDK